MLSVENVSLFQNPVAIMNTSKRKEYSAVWQIILKNSLKLFISWTHPHTHAHTHTRALMHKYFQHTETHVSAMSF